MSFIKRHRWKLLESRLRFTFRLVSVYLLITLLLWFFYTRYSYHPYTDELILICGSLFSLIAGFFAWTSSSYRNVLEEEIRFKTQQVFQKNAETKQAEMASAAIYQSSQLFSSVKFEALLEKVMELLGKVILMDEASLMLFDTQHNLYIAASHGIPDELTRSVHMRVGERVAGKVAQERRDFLIVDNLESYPEFKGIETNQRIRSSIVCPLVCKNELLGILNVNRTIIRENFTVANMMNVSIFASQVAQAIHNAYLYQALEEKITALETTNQKLKILQEKLQS